MYSRKVILRDSHIQYRSQSAYSAPYYTTIPPQSTPVIPLQSTPLLSEALAV